MLRSIKGNNASTISTVQIHVTGENAVSLDSNSGDGTLLIAILVSIIVVLLSALASSVVMLQKMSGEPVREIINNAKGEEAILLDK